jgi:hypothetical protein
MYLGIFNKHTRIHNRRIATPVSGFPSGKRQAAPIMLCIIRAALFLPFTFGGLANYIMLNISSHVIMYTSTPLVHS